jgi:predicted ATPase/class 3 adenylate cyclase
VGELPTGTVTFLFTDLEGSTRLWEQYPEAMKEAVARHDALLGQIVVDHRGQVVKRTGDGMYAVFATAEDGATAAVAAQLALAAQSWGPIGAMPVRMGLHTGVAEQRGGDYFGPVLNRAARLMAVAHAGQLLCSQTTSDLVRDSVPDQVGLIELGRHRLRDLTRPEVLFQLTHPRLPADFAPLRSLDAFPGNLPTQRTALIGRSHELQRLRRMLTQHRLLTLTGVGGVGKTRLALQLAADALDQFPDGAWLVELASIRDPTLVAGTVAAALDISERPGRPWVETLCDAIGSRALLVVLDNCEHLLDSTARLVDILLDACPNLRLVATSREALGIEGEQSWPTPSLGLPAAENLQYLEDLAGADSVELFVERARAVRPDFALSPANTPTVAALCRRLDGIPLAIELAAARVAFLGPQDILERIDQRFLILTGGSRTALERHQTLQAAVDWSYELLAGAERALFQRLSVFAGGFTLDAARAVAAKEGATDVEVLDLLGSLVAKSMVIAEGSRASVRYRVLETLRQYGRDLLAPSGEMVEVRDRHARYFLAFADGLVEIWFGPNQAEAWDLREVEFDNLRAAFEWLIETGDAVAAWRLVRAISLLWIDAGEGLRRHEALLAAEASLPAADQVEALASTGWLACQAGEHGRARELAEASMTRARETGAAPQAAALAALGLVAFWRSEPGPARERMEEAIAMARRADDGSSLARWQVVWMLNQACFVLGQTGAIARAIATGEEAIAMAREMGAPWTLSTALFMLALTYQSTDPERAARLLEESLQHGIGGGASVRGWTLVATGQLRGTLGDHRGALLPFAEALALSRQSGDRFFVPSALQGMARACRHLGQLEQATALLAAAEGMTEQLGIPGGPTDIATRQRAAARLRDLLGPEAFNAQWEAGRALSFDGIVALGAQVAAESGPITSVRDLSSASLATGVPSAGEA